MAFNIKGVIIREHDDYLKKGSRSRLETTMRSDLKNDMVDLMKHIREPLSVGLDVFVEMLQEDEKLLQKFIDKCKKY